MLHPALVPLSLLEAIRNLDTPVEDGLPDVADEVVAKRFGLSSTVAAQITRYEDAHARARGIPQDEVAGVFRLVARRPDAALVFADAGRRAARRAAAGSGRSHRVLARAVPGRVGVRLGRRRAARVAARSFGLVLLPEALATQPTVLAEATPALEAAPGGTACGFYGAAWGELLRVLAGFEGAVDHSQCRGTGASRCEWIATTARGYD